MLLKIMPSDTKISIIIPTYNEESNIPALLQKTHIILKNAGYGHELIVVDDGSKDSTRAKVRELQKIIPEIVLIERDTERGLASAMVRGYNEAHGEFLGAMDADLAHDPKHLPEMIALLENNQADFVIGSRYLPESRFEGKPLLNKITSLVGQFLVKIILRIRVKDTSNNYRIFRRAVWGTIKNKLHPDGNIMLTEIVYLAIKNNFIIKEIPIIYRERRAGKSKLNILQETIRFFRNIIRIKRNG